MCHFGAKFNMFAGPMCLRARLKVTFGLFALRVLTAFSIKF